MNRIWLVLATLAAFSIVSAGQKGIGESSTLGNKKPLKGEEVAILETDVGRIVVRFFKDKAPKHVANFKKLAKSKFYDGTYFHRTIPGFMIQGGDPNTKNSNPGDDGSGGPGWNVKAEFNDVKHVAGVLSAARSSDPDSAGSQFFLMDGQATHLDGQYSAFGQVVQGMDIVKKIVSAPTIRDGRENSRPQKPIHIKTARIIKWK